jgi:ribulose kinase
LKKNREEVFVFLFIDAVNIHSDANVLVFLSNFRGQCTPFNDPKARGVFAGLNLSSHYYENYLERYQQKNESIFRLVYGSVRPD